VAIGRWVLVDEGATVGDGVADDGGGFVAVKDGVDVGDRVGEGVMAGIVWEAAGNVAGGAGGAGEDTRGVPCTR
jgi:hypothetical protein